MEAIVEYNYVAQEPDELTLRKGEIIKEIKVIPGGWWEGTLRDKRGMFPDNFVKVLESSPNGSGAANKSDAEGNGTIKKEEVTLRNGSGRKYCKVLYSYDPCNEDELALMPQESIEFLGEIEEGWWRGRLRGRIGVFPSNFVTPPTPEEGERPTTDRGSKEMCRVLFSYDAKNEDELTLVEGEIVTALSRDVADKGWWKGELRGKVGLFPDNFVELINSTDDQAASQEMSQSMSRVSGMKHTYTGKKGEKAHSRKSLDTRHTIESVPKKMTSSASATLSSSSSMPSSQMANSMNDKILSMGNHNSFVSSSMKRMVEKPSDNAVEPGDSFEAGLNEELDGVERGEGGPLSHLTASRAKAPRRRLPSSQHFKNQSSNLPASMHEDNYTNGAVDTVDQSRSDEGDGVVTKARRKAPWIEELKMNQMEKRKTVPVEKMEKPEIKKERSHSPRPQASEAPPKYSSIYDEMNSVELRQKDKEQNLRTESSHSTCPVSPTASGNPPAYVPYKLYSQLLERVTVLEEKHSWLQRTVEQLSEQLSASASNKLQS